MSEQILKAKESIMPRLTVLHLVALTQGYGVERMLLDFLEQQNQMRSQIMHHVCALKLDTALRKELDDLGVPYITNNLRGVGALWRFRQYVQENDIQIVHSHNLLRYPIRTRILPKWAGIPILIEHEHGMIWNMRFNPTVRMTNHLVDLNICNSNAAKILLEKKCAINAHVIHNGIKNPIDDEVGIKHIREQLGIAWDDKVVGFVGRLNTPKGVHAFINIIPLVQSEYPNVKFVIVGDGPMRSELEKYAVRILGNLNNVLFLGFRKDARQIMHIMDMLVVPSIREPFGNVLVEAALAKKPVIASNVDGIPEVVVDGFTGFLIECNESAIRRVSHKASRLPRMVVNGETGQIAPPRLPDHKKMAQAVLRCLQDPVLSRKLGDQAQERALNLFSIERYTCNLEGLYVKVAERRFSYSPLDNR